MWSSVGSIMVLVVGGSLGVECVAPDRVVGIVQGCPSCWWHPCAVEDKKEKRTSGIGTGGGTRVR